jgi:hypothetical protein
MSINVNRTFTVSTAYRTVRMNACAATSPRIMIPSRLKHMILCNRHDYNMARFHTATVPAGRQCMDSDVSSVLCMERLQQPGAGHTAWEAVRRAAVLLVPRWSPRRCGTPPTNITCFARRLLGSFCVAVNVLCYRSHLLLGDMAKFKQRLRPHCKCTTGSLQTLHPEIPAEKL